MGAPQVLGLILSGRDSGTARRMKQMSARAISVASRTTRLSPYQADRYAPMAGLVTRLAAKVADTWRIQREGMSCKGLEEPALHSHWTVIRKIEHLSYSALRCGFNSLPNFAKMKSVQ